MKLECFLIDQPGLDIRPASSRRDWMDATPARFAYRCRPFSIANAHGWTIHTESAFEAEWNGGDKPSDVHVFADEGAPFAAVGHFGSGLLTLRPSVIFRTEPGYNLWVGGPTNEVKDGIQPLSAVMETDWMPFTFTMNWMFTRPNHRVRFEKGEPYCFLFPIPRGIVEDIDPVMRRVDEEPELEHSFKYAQFRRNFLPHVQHMWRQEGKPDEVENERMLRFQMWYMRGEMPDDEDVRFESHQKSLKVKPFEILADRDKASD